MPASPLPVPWPCGSALAESCLSSRSLLRCVSPRCVSASSSARFSGSALTSPATPCRCCWRQWAWATARPRSCCCVAWSGQVCGWTRASLLPHADWSSAPGDRLSLAAASAEQAILGSIAGLRAQTAGVRVCLEAVIPCRSRWPPTETFVWCVVRFRLLWDAREHSHAAQRAQ